MIVDSRLPTACLNFSAIRFFCDRRSSIINRKLPVAHAAIGELLGVNVIIRDEFFPESELIGRCPIQIENLIARTNIFFRGAMAFETPFHVKRVRLPGERHLIKLAMTCRAADAVTHMNAVVEKNEIWRVRDAVPEQWFILSQAFADGRKHGSVFPDLRMTGHAGFGRRQSGERGFFDGRMAKAAINSESKNMMLVTEWNRLFERNHFAGRVRRPINGVQNPPACAEQNHKCQQTCPCNGITTATKNLRHNTFRKF